MREAARSGLYEFGRSGGGEGRAGGRRGERDRGEGMKTRGSCEMRERERAVKEGRGAPQRSRCHSTRRKEKTLKSFLHPSPLWGSGIDPGFLRCPLRSREKEPTLPRTIPPRAELSACMRIRSRRTQVRGRQITPVVHWPLHSSPPPTSHDTKGSTAEQKMHSPNYHHCPPPSWNSQRRPRTETILAVSHRDL